MHTHPTHSDGVRILLVQCVRQTKAKVSTRKYIPSQNHAMRVDSKISNLTLQLSFGRLAEGQTVAAGVTTECQGSPDRIGQTQDQLHQEEGSHRSASNDTRLSQS